MKRITLSHGNGGEKTNILIKKVFLKYFNNNILQPMFDSSILPNINGIPVISTDSFVVNPIFFPGGDIGKLSICGTINDIATSGAIPLYITAGFVLEEGLKISDLERIVKSMAKTCKEANVKIVAGDTKVVEKGKGDKIYINTTGIGIIKGQGTLNQKPAEGDVIMINGTIGEHELAVLNKRKGLNFDCRIKSDCQFLSDLVGKLLKEFSSIKLLRDPTRGGLATVLNEIAEQHDIEITLNEENIPVSPETKNLCNILGLDPLFLANEGKMIIIASKDESRAIIERMREHKKGKKARIIGSITKKSGKRVFLKTRIGGRRVLNKLTGEMLPRIC